MTGDVGQEGFTMKSFKTLAMGAVMVLSLVGVSSASAANWDPQNTNVAATQEGNGNLTGVNGPGVTCTHGSTTLRAVGAVATTTTTTNPVIFNNCSTTGLALNVPAFVTTFGDWSFTATNTTDVDITATSNTGVVATIHVPLGGCDITVPSPVHITGTWNNVAHTLSVANAGAFAIHGSGGGCSLAGTTARMDVNFVAPTATIT